jgi:dTDP-L-rhamnose 4-epimerase
VRQVAELLAHELSWTGGFEIRQKFRAGDVRHCFADIARIQSLLGYAPLHTFEDGVAELVGWVANQQGVSAPVAAEVDRQLQSYGLLR